MLNSIQTLSGSEKFTNIGIVLKNKTYKLSFKTDLTARPAIHLHLIDGKCSQVFTFAGNSLIPNKTYKYTVTPEQDGYIAIKPSGNETLYDIVLEEV